MAKNKTMSEVIAVSNPHKFKALETRLNADKSADIWLYGVISDERWSDSDITSHDVVVALNSLSNAETITVHLNSNGGDVFEGVAIYATLQNYDKPVNIIGEGMIASIASVIALAGDTFAMTENSLFMMHNPLAVLFGAFNKNDMAKMSGELDKVRDSIISAYTNKTGMETAEVIALLDGPDGQGTYLSPEECLAMGFCDSIIPAKTKMVAQLQPISFKCRGHTLRLEYKNIKQTGGLTMPKTKSARRGKVKAELYPIECPACHKMCEFDDVSGVLTLAPEENATVAVPMETEARLIKKTFRNEVYKLCCPSCSCEFEYDTSPSSGVITDTESEYSPDLPIVQAKRGKKTTHKVKAKRTSKLKAAIKRTLRMETEEVPITCAECGEAFALDVDTQIEEAEVECPYCGAELLVDTEGVGEDNSEPDAEYDTEADPGNDDEEYDVVAFHRGVQAERQRVTALNLRKDAYPQYANAIDGFIKNGTSINCANEWIFTALASNPHNGVSAYKEASRRDAKVLNNLGGAASGGNRATNIAEKAESLAKRRGTHKNV